MLLHIRRMSQRFSHECHQILFVICRRRNSIIVDCSRGSKPLFKRLIFFSKENEIHDLHSINRLNEQIPSELHVSKPGRMHQYKRKWFVMLSMSLNVHQTRVY